jgi:PadR family transcriptional regulator, regulatory protein PadR
MFARRRLVTYSSILSTDFGLSNEDERKRQKFPAHRKMYFVLTHRASRDISIERLLVMEQEKKEVLKGTLDMLVLKVLAAGPLHGYAVSQRIQQISKDFFQVPEGSLYPALHRLEDKGWLQAKWEETDTGREAKVYTLTRAGRKRLETEIDNWEQLSEAVALILRTAE